MRFMLRSEKIDTSEWHLSMLFLIHNSAPLIRTEGEWCPLLWVAQTPSHPCALQAVFVKSVTKITWRYLMPGSSPPFLACACMCCFVPWTRYWGIVTVPGFPRVNRPQIITLGWPDPHTAPYRYLETHCLSKSGWAESLANRIFSCTIHTYMHTHTHTHEYAHVCTDRKS